MTECRALAVQPIGWVVQSAAPGAGAGQEAEEEIELDPAYVGALDGIEGFSHVWVIWWFHLAEAADRPLRVHPENRQEWPQVGVFATRSPRRPNPLALTAVRLLGREGARLRVAGLDAVAGSPVLDIKPYVQRGDFISGAAAPPWLEALWRVHDLERAAQQEEQC